MQLHLLGGTRSLLCASPLQYSQAMITLPDSCRQLLAHSITSFSVAAPGVCPANSHVWTHRAKPPCLGCCRQRTCNRAPLLMSVAVTEKVARLLAVALVTLLPLPVLLFSASHCCVRASKFFGTASLLAPSLDCSSPQCSACAGQQWVIVNSGTSQGPALVVCWPVRCCPSVDVFYVQMIASCRATQI